MHIKQCRLYLFFVLLFTLNVKVLATPPPLIDVIKTPVSEVKNSKQIKMPMITWGGDSATLYANGLSLETKQGSLFNKAGLDIKLVRQDNFKQQLKEYISGESPFLRCTVGMCNQAIELLSQDERIKPVVIYQMTWSKGGDGLVAKKGLIHTKYLRGKTISIQAYGPHVDFLTTILQDKNIGINEVNIDWQPDLTLSKHAPPEAFLRTDIDAAFMVLPDALVLTSNRSVGSGNKGSVSGARLITSTMYARRIIADVYVVRSDFLRDNRDKVSKIVSVLMESQRQMLTVMGKLSTKPRLNLLTKTAEYLLDDKTAIGPMEELILDAEFVNTASNKDFLQNPEYKYNLKKLTSRIQNAYNDLKLINGRYPLDAVVWESSELAATE